MSQTTHDATTALSWQVNADQDGPRLKDEGGSLAVRNADDTAMAIVRAAQPAGDNDVVTRRHAGGIVMAVSSDLTIPGDESRVAHNLVVADGVGVTVTDGAELIVL